MYRRPFAIASLAFLVVTATFAATASQSSSGNRATPARPDAVVGNQTCVKCHASEVRVWENTPHARTFDELHRRPEAKQIAARLGVSSIKHDGRCVNCHYTQQNDVAGTPHAISGVSCESCHGAAKDWLDLHHDYGGQGITRLSESPQHKKARIARSVAAGMRNPENVFSVAQSCLRCHTTADEQLVNVGGHSSGSLDFEFVAWSQGTIRHNFVRTDGKSNDVSTGPRLRLMFVSGMIAELEASMRATAVATQKAKFGITAAQRTARAAKRLQSVAAKTGDPTLAKILGVFSSVQLKLNNAAQLTAAADQISALGYLFAEQNDGSGLGSLDGFIPTSDRWK